MELTKRKKLQILKKMLEIVDNDGLCWAVQYAYYLLHDNTWPDSGCALMHELGIAKPKRVTGGYWWSRDKKGLESRKRAIRSAIKRLES